MKKFEEYIKEGKVQKKNPDPAEARSLFFQAKDRMADLFNLPLTEINASFRFEDAYEVLREALQAFLSIEGYKSYSHEAIFSFAQEKEIVLERKIQQADRYREIRNDINYRGKKVTLEEAKEIIDFMKQILPPLEKKFMDIVNDRKKELKF